MRIARVFPTKTSMTPDDQDAYFDAPGLFTPGYDEVHISVTFSWDKPRAEWLAREWEKKGKVKIGGVAIEGEPTTPFRAGIYLRKGITITSRGCPNRCEFCLVTQNIIEFDDFPEGNIIQDNNVLACSGSHWRKVLDMLKTQKYIEFKGGLEAARITPQIAEDLRSLKIKSLWLACDTPGAVKPLEKAVRILNSAGFTRSHLYCYGLIGKNRQEEEIRLNKVWEIGCMPFAQLYQSPDNNIYSKDWKKFQREWSRPAIIRTRMKQGPFFYPQKKAGMGGSCGSEGE